jgi:hypothetical protein
MPSPFQFQPARHPAKWLGRYERIPGYSSVFHLRRYGKFGWWPIIEWQRPDRTGTCPAQQSPAVEALVEAVNAAKVQLCGAPGGGFAINEFGQVIVPTSDMSRERLLVGEITGRLLFDNPFDGGIVDLGDDCDEDENRLKPGATWQKPYLGLIYHLSAGSKIYCWREQTESSWSEELPRQDNDLIHALRKIRRTGAVRFVVNPWRIVLTKKAPETDWQPDVEDEWEPVYVGRIERSYWFTKEETWQPNN